MKKTFIIATLCLILDQVVKNILLNIMMIGESKAIIKNFFNITLVQNDGAAFSTFRSNTLLLIIISLVMLIGIIIYIIKNKNIKKEEYILYGILMGGIAGNLIDRVIYQSVTDFLDFNIFGYPFPIFNIADICIVISMFGLALIAFKEEKRGNKSR